MEREAALQELKHHIVICNCSHKVKRIVQELHVGSHVHPLDVVLLVQDMRLWESHPEWIPDSCNGEHFFVIEGCPTEEEVLRKANISLARAAIILADPRQGDQADARSTLVAMAIERQNPQVHTVIELLSSINRIHLRSTKIDEIVCQGEISEKIIAQSCITPGIQNIVEHLLSTDEKTNQIYLPHLPAELRGITFRQMARRAIQAEASFIICGYIKNRNKEGRIEHARRKASYRDFSGGVGKQTPDRIAIINPRANHHLGKDDPLTENDQIIVISHVPPDLSKLA